MVIKVYTRDGIIWNHSEVIIQLCQEMASNTDIFVDMNNEGPDCRDIGLFDTLEKCAQAFCYDLGRVTVDTCNFLEQHDLIKIKKSLSLHLLQREWKIHGAAVTSKDHLQKHFGHFIGRSNAPRLLLASYLNDKHPDKVLSIYHYDSTKDYHRDHIGIESLINDYQMIDISSPARFLTTCPKKLFDKNFVFNKDQSSDHYDQLIKSERRNLAIIYQNFFVEIACETYFNGNTFFISEKTFRPMLLRTPFVVQGPVGFLKNLRDLGFQTFSRWWDEGYDEDVPSWSILEIIKVLDGISQMSLYELKSMYDEMRPVLDHNYNTAKKLFENQYSCQAQ